MEVIGDVVVRDDEVFVGVVVLVHDDVWWFCLGIG